MPDEQQTAQMNSASDGEQKRELVHMYFKELWQDFANEIVFESGSVFFFSIVILLHNDHWIMELEKFPFDKQIFRVGYNLPKSMEFN